MWTTDLGTSFVYLVNYRILQMFTFSILFPHVLPLKTHPGSNWRSSAVLPWDDRRRSATSAVARRAAQRRPWRPRAPTRSAAPGGSPPARPGTPGTEWERLYDCDFRTTYWILSYLNLFIHFIHIISIYIIYIYKVKIHAIICFWCVWKTRVADPKVSHEVCWSCSKVAVLQKLPSPKRMWRP